MAYRPVCIVEFISVRLSKASRNRSMLLASYPEAHSAVSR
jgi:hypothetical protein